LQAGQLAQLDEMDMGMTYKELSVFGRLRKQNCAGPFTTFCRLVHLWDQYTPKEVSQTPKQVSAQHSSLDPESLDRHLTIE